MVEPQKRLSGFRLGPTLPPGIASCIHFLVKMQRVINDRVQ